MPQSRRSQAAPSFEIRGGKARESTVGAQARRRLAQTIVIDRERKRVLLAFHKSGRWRGFYTGFLDEVLADEDPGAAAIRIVAEQASITISRSEHIATFTFISKAWTAADEFEFLAESHRGVPREVETIRPEWFAIDSIPFARMPADDAIWYPAFLAGKRMRGRFHFAGDGTTLLSHEIEEVDRIETS